MSIEFAAGKTDITPDSPMPLVGFAGRRAVFRDVAEPLEANVLSLAWGDEKVHLVSLDLLYGGSIGTRVRTGLPAPHLEHVFALGSHTHFAPGMDAGLPSLGIPNEDYVAGTSHRIKSLIGEQRYAPVGALPTSCSETSGLFVNRRRPILSGGVRLPRVGRTLMAPHPRGGTDPVIRVAGIMRGRTLAAVIWGASCHPVCSPEPDVVSACFPGVVRRLVREHLGAPDLPVLFLQGFSGDVRPNTVTRRLPRGAKAAVSHVLAGGRRFAIPDASAYHEWCGRLADHVIGALGSLEAASGPPAAVGLSSVVHHPAGWARPVRLSEVQLSPTLRLVMVNAEVVHERVAELERRPGLTIPVGCVDEVIGYWPTDRMIQEGGYESNRSRAYFPVLDWGTVGGPDRLWRQLLTALTEARGYE